METKEPSKIIVVGNPQRDLPRDLLFTAYSPEALARAVKNIALKHPMGSDEFGILMEAHDRLKM